MVLDQCHHTMHQRSDTSAHLHMGLTCMLQCTCALVDENNQILYAIQISPAMSLLNFTCQPCCCWATGYVRFFNGKQLLLFKKKMVDDFMDGKPLKTLHKGAKLDSSSL